MPWLQSQIFDDAEGHWLWFPDAFLSTPLCCPSRASILTGQYAHNTGVLDNHQGENLDESNTLATWLQGGGYTTALFGKYLNEYPWDRGPYVPPWLEPVRGEEQHGPAADVLRLPGDRPGGPVARGIVAGRLRHRPVRRPSR